MPEVFITFRLHYEGDARRMVGGRSSSDPSHHDIHLSLMHMTAAEFSDFARRALSGSTDLNDVMVASGMITLLVGSECSSYDAWIEKDQFVSYLADLGLSPGEAVSMTETEMDAVRDRAGFQMVLPRAPGF